MCGLVLLPIASSLDFLSNGGVNLFSFNITNDIVAWIILTCVLAMGVNYTTYLLVGKTSAVSFQVIGTLKTSLTFIVGIIMFREHPKPHQIIGIIMGLMGMVLYSHFKQQQHVPAASQKLSIKPQ